MRPVGVVGNLSLDIVDGAPPRVGGAVYYAARALSELGVPAVLATKCAPDHRTRLLAALSALGFPVDWHPAASTTTFSLNYDGESRRLSVDAVGDPWSPGEVEGPPLDGTSCVHAGALLRSDFPPETLAALARSRMLLLAGHGLVRPGRTGPVVPDSGFDPAVLEYVHVLMLSEEEAHVVVGDVGETELRQLDVPEVIVTLGSRGSLVLAGGRLARVDAEPVDGADPTGAGDGFAAGYLAKRSTGLPPLEAARSATELVRRLLARQAP